MAKSKRLAGAAGAIVAAALALFVGGWEGERLVAYRDIANVWTICNGETEGVRPGDTDTPAGCRARLTRRLDGFAAAVERCVKVALPDERFIAVTSLAYNIGEKAMCESSAVRLLNAGRTREGCDAILLWDKARVRGVLQRVQGLANRREAERALCLVGVSP